MGAAAYGVRRFRYDRAGIERMFNHSELIPFIQHSFTHTSGWLTLVAIGPAAYALIELAEGTGLWLARRWGEYLAMVATSVIQPFEIYELTKGTSPG